MPKIFLTLFVLMLAAYTQARNISGLVARFSFDHGTAKNELTSDAVKTVGVSLTEDRFGNPASACYLHGNSGSYLNLGTGSVLKPASGTISLWFKMDNIVYSGKGYETNPIIVTKTHAGNDFYEAYTLCVDVNSKRLNIVSSHVAATDTLQAGVRSEVKTEPGRWYHAVLCYNDSMICLYVDGVRQSLVSKGFMTSFLEGDSVIVGYSANTKNSRFFNGSVDDIEIYNRVLPASEIQELYNASNPNKSKNVIEWLTVIVLCTASIALLMVLLLEREKKRSRRQRRIYEMEMQVMKAQMNPHFIFNAINSVQQFIVESDNDNAQKYLVKFSRLLRMILESNREASITLEHEIEILTRYIEIEALRFDQSFSYEIVTDAGMNTSKIRIPQMLIQPLVENAIWHGLLPKEEDRFLSIKFRPVNDQLLSCIVEDNGVGLKARKAGLQAPEQKSLAINFISHRLELMRREWKNNYGISIVDKADVQAGHTGTSVTIRLPILN